VRHPEERQAEHAHEAAHRDARQILRTYGQRGQDKVNEKIDISITDGLPEGYLLAK
jgi:hypothetical protein